MALADAPSLGHITSPIASSFPVKIVTDSPSFALTKSYRYSVFAGKEGFRSRPRTLTECHILPLLLMKPVRWPPVFIASIDYFLFRYANVQAVMIPALAIAIGTLPKNDSAFGL
jgi:hypothetical protein